MLRALLLVARWIGLAHDRWRDATRQRPLTVEIDLLRELVGRLQAESVLLRARLARLESARRPRYRPWERLRILWHQARYGLTLRATARAFVLSTQTLVNWHKDAALGAARIVATRVPLNRLPENAGPPCPRRSGRLTAPFTSILEPPEHPPAGASRTDRSVEFSYMECWSV